MTDPWGQQWKVGSSSLPCYPDVCLMSEPQPCPCVQVLQCGQAGDFPWSMGIAEVQLPVHCGEDAPMTDIMHNQERAQRAVMRI